MDVKQATDVFNIEKKEIYELGNRGLSGVRKVGRKWLIPDDTEVLISLDDIRLFLYHLLKYKNNDGYVFPRKMCPDDTSFISLVNQQYRNGFVSSEVTDTTKSIDEIIKSLKLTDEAIDLILGDRLKEEFDGRTKSMTTVVFKAPTINILSPNASIL